jgi:hypothetical protein
MSDALKPCDRECLFCGTHFAALYATCPVCEAKATEDALRQQLSEAVALLRRMDDSVHAIKCVLRNDTGQRVFQSAFMDGCDKETAAFLARVGEVGK